jgi:uncharacterized protein (DUF433 family)
MQIARTSESEYVDNVGTIPVLRGTDIKVSLIASEYEHLNMAPDEIVEAHPHLTLAQTVEAGRWIGKGTCHALIIASSAASTSEDLPFVQHRFGPGEGPPVTSRSPPLLLFLLLVGSQMPRNEQVVRQWKLLRRLERATAGIGCRSSEFIRQFHRLEANLEHL